MTKAILNLLRTLEEASGTLVISFSAWSASGEGGVISQFYATLADKLRSESIRLPIKQRAKSAAAKASKFAFLARWIGIGAKEVVPVPPLLEKVATEMLSRLSATASTWGRIGHKDLESIVELLNGKRVVVFIDDLDRADPRLVPKTLLAMRELLDWPGFSFVLAFDKRAISSALAEYSKAFGDDAQGFLEKVIDVPFEVPSARDEERKHLAMRAFTACCSLIGVRRHLQHFGRLLQTGVETGEVKLFAHRALQAAGGGELNAVVAAQGEGVGVVTGQLHQRLSDFDDGIAGLVGAQARADGLDCFGVARVFAHAAR